MGAPPFSDADGFRARFKGFSGTANAGQTTYISYKVTEERWINGIRLMLNNHHPDDKLDFEIVDVEGIYSAAGTVLDVFASDWFVDDSNDYQADVMTSYPAKILSGLYVRIKYTSSSIILGNVKVKANLFLHKRTV